VKIQIAPGLLYEQRNTMGHLSADGEQDGVFGFVLKM
jgi:hypothetical protein